MSTNWDRLTATHVHKAAKRLMARCNWWASA